MDINYRSLPVAASTMALIQLAAPYHIDDVAALVAVLGRGSLLAKVDIESAYRLIPVHPQDRPLQAMVWEGQLFIDPMLPFGLRSAPKISMRLRTLYNGAFVNPASSSSTITLTTISSSPLLIQNSVLGNCSSSKANVPDWGSQ